MVNRSDNSPIDEVLPLSEEDKASICAAFDEYLSNPPPSESEKLSAELCPAIDKWVLENFGAEFLDNASKRISPIEVNTQKPDRSDD